MKANENQFILFWMPFFVLIAWWSSRPLTLPRESSVDVSICSLWFLSSKRTVNSGFSVTFFGMSA